MLRLLPAAVVVLALVAAPAPLLETRAASRRPELLQLDGDISPVHDPVIIKDKDTWYLFCTGGTIRRSKDLHHWTLVGKVFERLPEWAIAEIPGTRSGYWAPDISVYKGVYRLYYAISTFGQNDSAIGLATNKTLDPDSPDYKWVDQGMVLRSHKADDYNAIDPHLAVDKHGNQWLDFGSFWGGIKMRRVDPQTGKLSAADHTLYSLASRSHNAHPSNLNGPPVKNSIEAPFIVRRNRYYYLFVSFDFCCRGANSTYNVVVGRSSSITGPYEDRDGKPMMQGGGTRVTNGTSLWRGPGHEGILLQKHGMDLMVFHAYNATTGKAFLQISTVTWENGWPDVTALPGDPIAASAPSRLHMPPQGPRRALHKIRMAPLPLSTVISCPSAKKPIPRLSGAHKGNLASSVPLSCSGTADDNVRIQKLLSRPSHHDEGEARAIGRDGEIAALEEVTGRGQD